MCQSLAAKSLQSCPTLCDPIDSSPPGPAVPGILQARTPYSDLYFGSVSRNSLKTHLPLTLHCLFSIAALWPTAAVEIYTPRVLEAVNGTDVRLKCTFSSFAPVGDALTVTWNFRPRDGGPEQFVSLGPLIRKISQSISPGPFVFFLAISTGYSWGTILGTETELRGWWRGKQEVVAGELQTGQSGLLVLLF